MSLFTRPPETIVDYKPKFTQAETLLGYRCYRCAGNDRGIGFRGIGYHSDEWDRQTTTRYQHSITVQGTTICGQLDSYDGSDYSIVALIANEFLAGNNQHTAAYKWLMDNAIDLTNSARYWDAMIRVDRIHETKRQITILQEQVRIAEMLASVDAVGVMSEVSLNPDQRYLLAIEFGMTPEEVAASRR